VGQQALTGWILGCLLLSLRVGPVFMFAPPFSLVRMPMLVRILLSLGIAACVLSSKPDAAREIGTQTGMLVAAALNELLLGSVFVLALQLAFGGLYIAGRTIDIQAGFGLSLLIDPTTRGQTPLVGTLFAYAAGAVFFALDGHLDLLRIMAASLDAVPLGAWHLPVSLDMLTAFIATMMTIAFGIAGAAMLALFLADLAIALLSRTVPQMNVLVLGFQVKTVLLLLTLPVTFGVAGSLFVRFVAVTLEALPGLI